MSCQRKKLKLFISDLKDQIFLWYTQSMLKSLLFTILTLSFMSCGLIKDKKVSPPQDVLVKIVKPSDSSKIETAQLSTVFNQGTFFKNVRGSFNASIRENFFKVASILCKSTSSTQVVVLKVDGDYIYTYEEELTDGGTDYVVQNGVAGLKCTSEQTESVKVVKSKPPKTFAELMTSLKPSGSSATATAYKVGRNLEIYTESKDSQNNGVSLIVFEEPNELPMVQSLNTASSEYISSLSHGGKSEKYEFGIKSERKSYGDAYPLETLRDELKKIEYCIEAADGTQDCKNDQDLSYLL